MSVFRFDPHRYGSRFAPLLVSEPLSDLGPGKANEAMRAKISELDSATILEPKSCVDRDMAACCISALWLLYDFLDESHSISQAVETTSGSYWHGIMHRRELDFSNAKYWFRRVGRHEIFPPLCDGARQLASAGELDRPTAFLATQMSWDPLRFIDLCEAVTHGSSMSNDLCRHIAQLEWRLLFDFCYRQAVGD